MKYEHDSLENDTGSSASEFSHIHHDTKEGWNKLEMVSLKPHLQYTSIPAKKSKRLFQKDFSVYQIRDGII